MKQKLIFIALTLVLLLGLCACGSMDAAPTASPVPEETATPAVTDWTEELMPDVEDGIVDDHDGILDNEEGMPDVDRGILDGEEGIFGNNKDDSSREGSSMTTDNPAVTTSPNSKGR